MQDCNYVLKIINSSLVLKTEHQVPGPAELNSPMNSCSVEFAQRTIQNNSYIWCSNVRTFYCQQNIMGQLSILSSIPGHLHRAGSFSKPQKKPSLLRRTFSLKSVRNDSKKRVKFSGVSWSRFYSRDCNCVEDEPGMSKPRADHKQTRR